MPSVSPASAALTLAVLALAVFRLSVLVTVEEGPFDLARRLRIWVMTKRGHPPAMTIDGLADGLPDGVEDWVVTGFGCPWCVSFWLALPAALTWGALTGAAPMLVLAAWPAISAVTLVLYRH